MADVPRPADFFIGISEFFGSLAPGTVLVAMLWRLGTVPGFDASRRELIGFSGGALVVALVVGGYLAGNLVSVLGATLDESYDAVRQLRYPRERDAAYRAAETLRDAELGIDGATAAPMNTFQWARAVLAIEHRDAYDEVSRLEAASKLFRSLVVVSLTIAVAAALRAQLNEALGGIAGAVLAYWPYVDRRYKSTEAAYRLVIVLRCQPHPRSGKGP